MHTHRTTQAHHLYLKGSSVSEAWQWLQPTVEGDLLTPRGVHTAAVVKNRLVVFGGSRDFDAETMQCETYLGDTYALDVGKWFNLEDFPFYF